MVGTSRTSSTFKPSVRQRLSDVNKIRYRRPQRYNLERLKDREVASQYAQELEAALPEEGELVEAPLEDCWRRTEAAINEAATSAVGYVERVRQNGWFDEECQEILAEKNAARAVWLQRNLRGNKESYKRLKRQQTHLFRDKKRRLEELECQDMEQLYRSNETRKFYKKLNKSRTGFMPRAEMCRDKDGGLLTNEREVIERWKQHFDEHLNGEEAEYQDDRGDDFSGVADGEEEPTPTMSEVKDAINKLKNNKSAGKDGIGAELIKMGPGKLVACLHRLIVKIWDTEQLPEEWKEGVISPIYKKGDKLECENYRAITTQRGLQSAFPDPLLSSVSAS